MIKAATNEAIPNIVISTHADSLENNMIEGDAFISSSAVEGGLQGAQPPWLRWGAIHEG